MQRFFIARITRSPTVMTGARDAAPAAGVDCTDWGTGWRRAGVLANDPAGTEPGPVMWTEPLRLTCAAGMLPGILCRRSASREIPCRGLI